MEWPAGWSFHQSLVLLLCGDTECPGEVAAWKVDLGGFAELRNVTQALPSRRAGYCFLFKGMNGETGIYSNKRKKTRKWILPCPAWMPPEWNVRRRESSEERGKEGGPEHSKWPVRSPERHPDGLWMMRSVEWDDSGEIQALRRISVSFWPPPPTCHLSVSLSLIKLSETVRTFLPDTNSKHCTSQLHL